MSKLNIEDQPPMDILFRGKRVDNGEWVEGYLYASNMSGCYILQTQTKHRKLKSGGVEIYDQLIPIQVDGSTVGQFTGFLDKNDKKVYTGDICRLVYREPFSKKEEIFTERIMILRGVFGIRSFNGMTCFPLGEFDKWNIEIVANIYDEYILGEGESNEHAD